MSTRNRGYQALVAGLACVGAYLLFVAVSAMSKGNLASDSGFLVQGVRVALDCLDDGVYTKCGNDPGTPFTDVGPYAPLQYVPALLFVKLGFTDAAALRGLAWLNFAAFVGLLVLLVVGTRRLRWRGWGPVLMVAALASPMLYQSTASFGESLAATTLLSLLVAVVYRRPVLIGLTAFATGLSKETMFVFALLLVLAVGRRDDDGLSPPRRVLLPTAAGLAAAMAVSVLLNLFRFGSPRNLNYLLPLLRTPLGRRIEYLAGLWVAPNVGLLFYAALATLLIGGAGVYAVRGLGRGRAEARTWIPPLAVVVAAGGFTLGLATWFAPFGWDTYGSRLFMPFLPAATFAAVVAAEPFLNRAVRAIVRRPWALAGVVAVVCVTALPQFASPWSWPRAVHALKQPSAACPNPNVGVGSPEYYTCMSDAIWRVRPSALGWVATASGWQPKAGMALLGAGSALLLVGAAGRRVRVDQDGPGS